MKKLFLFLITLFSLLILGCENEIPEENEITFGKEVFYWYKDQKVYLYEKLGVYSVLLDTTMTYENAYKTLKSNINIKYVVALRSDDYLISVFSELSLSELKKQKGILNAVSAYTSQPKNQQSQPIYLTGKITMVLKDGISIDSVLDLINNETIAMHKNTTRYDLQIKDWSKIFEYNDIIYKSGKVVFCEPEFIGGYTVFN